jgi:hypothetical protein
MKENEEKINTKVTSLNYSRAKIKTLPKEILDRKDSLIELDISGNNFPDFKSVVNELNQFKKLKKLKINIFTQEQAKTIIDSMPNLEYLNDEPINDDIIPPKEKKQEKNIIKILDNNYKSVFKKFKEFYKLNKERKDEYKNIIKLFNTKCKELNIKENKSIEKLSNEEINKELILYKVIFNELNKIKDELNMNKYNSNSLEELFNIMEENEKIKNRCNKILNERQNKKDIKEQKEKHKSPKNTFKQKKNKMIYHEAKTEQCNNINININTNKIMKQDELYGFYDDKNLVNLLLKSKSEFNALNIFDDQNNDIIIKEKINTRILNLNNLLEIINQTYKIRNSRIEKQKEGFYNKGTLEQDLYTYLKSKYGLKKLIIEWNMNIISSIQAYYKINGEVFLFALLLKNELDEESIEILNKIKRTVNNILNIIYDYNINKISKIKQNKEFINENEWKAISTCLYSDDDFLKEKFINEVEQYINNIIKRKDLIEKTGQKILYEDFINLLIIFNMKLRKMYLHNLFNLFTKEDKKKIGIIYIDNFKQIIRNSGIIKDEQKLEDVIEKLVEIIDIEGSGQITFSDCVQCLDKLDLITEEGKIKFLDKLSNINF